MGIWTPEAQWVGPTPNQSGRMVEQRGMILHVMQGSLAGSIAWGKNPASRVSFHFGTRKDGLVQQLVDTDVTAWTQGAGNGRWISVENEDFSGNPLSAAQVESVAKLYARGVREYGWPLQATDSTAGRGLGWHGMGGVAWGNHPNCPGEPIKAQRPAILARAAQLLGTAPPSTEEDDMYLLRELGTGLYWLIGGGRDPQTGMPYATQVHPAQLADYRSAGIFKEGNPVPSVSPQWYAKRTPPLTGGVVEVELTDEQLQEIAAAAERGAEAGAPTEAELVEAAREGANLAEDS